MDFVVIIRLNMQFVVNNIDTDFTRFHLQLAFGSVIEFVASCNIIAVNL